MSEYVTADGLSVENVPARIRTFRDTYNLSQDDLGKLVGKTRATIIRWEHEGPGENLPLVVLALTQLSQRLSARKG
jgi:DNA-binding XRE family transcriptional regulator